MTKTSLKFLMTGLLVVFIITAMQAQKSKIGIKGGINLSTLSGDNDADKNLLTGFHIGIVNRLQLTDHFAIQPELLYTTKGVKYNYDDNILADGESKFKLSYIEFPINLAYVLTENLEVQAGPYFSYLANAKLDTDAEVLDFWEIDSEDDIDRENFNDFDFGLGIGLAFNFESLIFGVNYKFGLTPVAKDGEVSHDMLDKAKNSTIQAYVGFVF